MSTKQKKKQPPQPHRFWKWLMWICAALLAIALAVWIAFQVSPWPSALLIRDEFIPLPIKACKPTFLTAPPLFDTIKP